MPDRLEADYMLLEPLSDPSTLHLRRPRPPPTKSRFSPAVRFCIGFACLVTLVVTGLITYGIYSFARSTYADISKPHKLHHANETDLASKNESAVVRSFFGSASEGGVERFDLQAAVYVRLPVEGEEAGGEKAEGDDLTWELVYKDIVMRDVEVDSKAVTTVVPVSLRPSHLIALSTNLSSFLHANFIMLPSSASLSSSSLSPRSWQTSRNKTASSSWAPANVDLGERYGRSEDGDAVPSFFANSACWTSLSSTSYTVQVQPDNFTEPAEKNLTSFVSTRSWVSMAHDFPAYRLEAFNSSLNNLSRWRQRHCKDGSSYGGECVRAFSRDGHFENLLEVEGDGVSRYRYSPFVTARLGYAGPMDYLRLPAKENITDEGLSFNWTITWRATKPAKLAFVTDWSSAMSGSALPNPAANQTEYELADGQDATEIIHSLFGYYHRENARPKTRFFLRLLQFILSFAVMPLQAYYWWSRSRSTGIVLVPHALATLYALLQTGYDIIEERSDMSIGSFVALHGVLLAYNLTTGLAQLNLVFRLEWQWGGPYGFVPVGFSRRRMTRSEKKSKEVERTVPWLYQVTAIAVLALVLRFGPKLPPAIAASGPPMVLKKKKDGEPTLF
ncbi:hypothetical protein JCM8097_004677, partial [Rhodosporidiobolus ruineniae]